MTFKTYEINVDLVNDTSTTSANRFSQNDRNSAKLLLTITNKGAELDLSQAKSVRMSFRKSDGTRVFQNDCQPINAMKGKYQILLKTQTLTSVGNVIAQIHIEEEDRVIDTQKFFFVVNDSLASDEAIESTNEFTIIQKAIEAGKKLQGKDIDAIIAAGAKADAALPKAGGTMTGNIDSDISVGSKSKGYRWKDANGTLYGLESATDGALILYDYKSAARVWQYDPVAKRFTVLADTNLLKKTGDTLQGNLTFEGSRDLIFSNANSETILRNNTSGSFALYDKKNDHVPWSYTPSTRTFNVGGETNLLKKTGDTMTGNLQMDISSGARAFRFVDGIDNVLGLSANKVSPTKYTTTMFDNKNNLNVWQYESDTKTFNVSAPNTNLVTKAKDGRSTLTLTADATNWDATVGTYADRRGNTVTVKMAVKRNAGSTNTTVTTLPVDMRPLSVLTQYFVASDGTPVKVVIDSSTGVIQVASADKSIYLIATYVVD